MSHLLVLKDEARIRRQGNVEREERRDGGGYRFTVEKKAPLGNWRRDRRKRER